MEEIEVGDWIKVRCGDGLCRIYEVVAPKGDWYIGLGGFGFTIKSRVLEVRKSNGNKEEKDRHESKIDEAV